MSVPHQQRHSPLVVLLAALGTAGAVLLFPVPDAAPPVVHDLGAGRNVAPLEESPRLMEDIHRAAPTLTMFTRMRAVLEEDPQADGEARDR